ncbi:MAG: type II toxin-antitoxin system RelE/ParE family toxin [Nitrospira sp. SB0666_bin_27]|nr:type II toxin-antitoxin system RelE/ParE family toxin [Nitrospira sp. SB0666_bin_27]MYF25675.1 type II toxin-antitoxin system RelE/ParE family toxin [Nitrospira sp. SB0678_bin_10]
MNERDYLGFLRKKNREVFSGRDQERVGSPSFSPSTRVLLGMPQSRKIPVLHQSAFELRIKDENGIYRVFYALFDGDTILVPHAFTKKTQKTPQKEIDTAKQRLRRMIHEHQSTRQKPGKRS